PPATTSYQAGVVADHAVKAQRSVSFISDSITDAERERAAAAVPKQYKRDPSVAVTETGKLSATLIDVARIRADQTGPRDQKIVAAPRITESAIGGPIASDTVDMPVAEWDALAKEVDRSLQNVYAQGLREEQVDQAMAEVTRSWPQAWNDRQKRVATGLVTQHMRANDLADPAATVAAQAAARAAVPAVQAQGTTGAGIVRQGSVVTPH